MKKSIYYLFLALTLFSCQDEFLSFDENATNSVAQVNVARFRTPAEAADAASDICDQIYGSNSRSAKNIDLNSIVCVRGGGRDNIDTLMYIVNFDNNQGYAMIAGPTNLPPIYAVIDSGQLNSVDDITNPGFLNYYNNVIADITESLAEDDGREIKKHYEIIKSPVIDYDKPRRVIVNWGQKGVLAKYCPNGVVGCTPLASAMAMTYLEYPTSLDITFPGAPVNHVDLDWSLIKNGMDNEAAALLCRELGHRMKSVYKLAENPDQNSTGTTAPDHYSVMSQILPDNISSMYHTSYPEELFPHQYIRDSGVLLVDGLTTDFIGHSFIIDGFKYYFYEEAMYVVTPGYIDDDGNLHAPDLRLIEVLVHEEKNLVHVNWGWSGFDNGYFKGNLIGNRYGESYDNPYLQLGNSSSYIFTDLSFFSVK